MVDAGRAWPLPCVTFDPPLRPQPQKNRAANEEKAMLNDLFKPVIPKAKPVAKPPPPKKKDIYSDDRDDGKEKGSTFAGCRLPSPACGARGARPPLVFARSPRPAPCRCSGRVGPVWVPSTFSGFSEMDSEL